MFIAPPTSHHSHWLVRLAMVEIPIRTHEIELSFQRRRTLVLPPQIQSIEDEMSIEFPQILLTCFKFLIVHHWLVVWNIVYFFIDWEWHKPN